MDENTEAIVRLCFARQLGLADDALELPGRVRVERPDLLMVLRLWQTVVVVGPTPMQSRAEALDEQELLDASTLLGLSGGGRLLGAAELSVADEFDRHPELQRIEVDADPDAAVLLERGCPPDDVTEVGLAEMDAVFVHRDPETGPVAGSGYSLWAGLVANVGVLSHPSARRRGLGRVLAGVAVNDALDAGLVPLWRARQGNLVSARLGIGLGFHSFGTQTTVRLDPG